MVKKYTKKHASKRGAERHKLWQQVAHHEVTPTCQAAEGR